MSRYSKTKQERSRRVGRQTRKRKIQRIDGVRGRRKFGKITGTFKLQGRCR